MSKEVDAAIELLKAALRRELDPFPVVTSFMGMTPIQIQKLRNFYRGQTGMDPEDL